VQDNNSIMTHSAEDRRAALRNFYGTQQPISQTN